MLTDAGRTLYEFCAPFFEGLTPLVQAIEQGLVEGQLRIDAAALEISQVLPRWIKRLRRELPDVQGRGQGDRGTRLRSLALGTNRLDRQLSAVAAARRASDARRHLLRLSRRSARARARRAATRAQEHGERAVRELSPGSSPYALQLGALREAGCTPSSIVNASSVAGILGFVESGLCYSLVPWGDARGPRLPG